MQVARWGNSLAVRIPADVVRTLGLREGDDVDLKRLDDGALALITKRQQREVALKRLGELAVDLPPDYKFDRDAAHER